MIFFLLSSKRYKSTNLFALTVRKEKFQGAFLYFLKLLEQKPIKGGPFRINMAS